MVLTLVALAATLAVGVSAQDVLITTTVNETHCITGSNVGNFYHYGAAFAFAGKGKKAAAIQYEGTNVTCCQFELAYDNVRIEEVSKNAQPTPCSSLAQCEASNKCDENATCVMSSEGSFICQCTELYEGDGFSCSRKPHWSEWSAFGPYSKSCGEGATRTRTRTCSKPPRCEGSDTDSETVDLEACPIRPTTTRPPTRYQACGTEKCKACPGGPDSCTNSGLDRDKDKEDLRKCPSGYRDHDYKWYDQIWPFSDVYLRICASLPPSPVGKYFYEMCGAVNCIGCDQENCQEQRSKHLAPASQVAESAQCSEGYSDVQDSENEIFRVCRSDEKVYGPWALP